MCHVYSSPGNIAVFTGVARDSIAVTDGFELTDLAVTVSVAHASINALKISLTAQPPSDSSDALPSSQRTIILKSSTVGGAGGVLQRTTFNDSATQSLPESSAAAPFSGTYLPVQRLSFLYDGEHGTEAGEGGTLGTWVLQVDDPVNATANRGIALNGWSLRMCGLADAASTAPAAEVSTNSQSPAVTASSGPAQAATATAGTATVPSPPAAQKTGLFGWSVVSTTGAVSPTAAGPAPSTVAVSGARSPPSSVTKADLLQSLKAAVTAYTGGDGLCHDATCQAAKNKLWKGALYVLYASAAMDGLKTANRDTAYLVSALRDLLPGDNPALTAYLNWLQNNRTRLDAFVTELRQTLNSGPGTRVPG